MYQTNWDAPTRTSPFALTPWVRRLLIANAVIYLLTLTVLMGRWFFEAVAFSPANALIQPWTFITYMFVHGGFLHLAFNMLMLFFFGPSVEERMGSTPFIRYYLLCGLGGAAFSFVINIVAPVQPFIGASAAVFGVSLAFAVHWPNAPIFVFPIPVPIKAKWLVIGLATIDLTMAIVQANDGVAHLAHLGGFLAGLIYLKGLPRFGETKDYSGPQEREVRVLVHPSAKMHEESGAPPEDQRSTKESLDEIDRLLDKISATGLESLTDAERRLLYDRSRRLRDN